MNAEVQARLEVLREDFAEHTGKPFQYFYCPLLHVDEPRELQMGHVINEAFEGSPNTWVVQRQDVDRFYGSRFEADFEVIQYAYKKMAVDYFSDKKLYERFRPRIFRGDVEVKHFPYRKGKVPPGYCVVNVECAGGKRFPICLNAPEIDALRNDQDQPWWIEVKNDMRVAALVTLLKSASNNVLYVRLQLCLVQHWRLYGT